MTRLDPPCGIPRAAVEQREEIFMAEKVTVERVDDLTGESGATTRHFGLDGIDYEIDLVDDQALRDRLTPWIAKARKISGRKKNTTAHTNGQFRHDMHRIRIWAKANNHAVPARGKMPASIFEAYDKHHSGQ